MRQLICKLVAIAAMGIASSIPVDASAADFYKGNKIRILIGTTPGAGCDLMARLVAAHIHIIRPIDLRAVYRKSV